MWCKTDKDPINSPDCKLLENSYFMKIRNKYIPIMSKIKKINNDQTNWLKDFIKIANEKNKKVIVLTHYLPSINCINEKYKTSPRNEYYYTPCDDLFENVDYWIAGHTHTAIDIEQDNCRIIINPVGTPGESNKYNKSLVIDV